MTAQRPEDGISEPYGWVVIRTRQTLHEHQLVGMKCQNLNGGKSAREIEPIRKHRRNSCFCAKTNHDISFVEREMSNRETPKQRRWNAYRDDRPADLMVLNTVRRRLRPIRKQVGNESPTMPPYARRCTRLRNSTVARDNSTQGNARGIVSVELVAGVHFA